MKIALLLLGLWACGPEDTGLARDESPSSVNRDRDFVVIVDVNWENLPTPGERPCPGEYRDLIYWMKDQPQSPDFVIVQQVSGQDQADRLARVMSDLLAGTWRAIVAERNPKRQGSPCGDAKEFQTNAILYRPGAFEPVGEKRVFQTFTGARNGGVVSNDQSRTKTIVQRFRDKRWSTTKTLSIGSTHWATAKSDATPKSALASMRRVHQNMSDSGGSLRIWGGDTNMSDLQDPDRASSAFRDWYQEAIADYRDAAHSACSGSKSCLIERHQTTGRKRIDYLMAARRNGKPEVDRVNTVGFAEAGQARSGDNPNLHYSQHRAVSARIWY